MTTKPSETATNRWNLFTCQLCQAESMEPPAFTAHLRDAHGMEASGWKSTINHLDAADWFEWNYSWSKEQDGKPFAVQSVRNPRRKNDPMRDLLPKKPRRKI